MSFFFAICGTAQRPLPTFLGYYSTRFVCLQQRLPPGRFLPVGKSYASIVDDEKSAFEQGRKHRQNGHKNPAASIVAAFADKGG